MDSRKYQQEKERDNQRTHLVQKYKSATEKLVEEQRNKVEEAKTRTSIISLLKSKKSSILDGGRGDDDEDDDDDDVDADVDVDGEEKHANANANADDDGNGGDGKESKPSTSSAAAKLLPSSQTNDSNAPPHVNAENSQAMMAARNAEWMKSLMLPYVSSMFAAPGFSHMYRQSAAAFHMATSQGYRGSGFVPRILRGRGGVGGRGRGRGRYYYDGKHPMSYYNSNNGGGGGSGSGGGGGGSGSGGGNTNRYNQPYHYGNYNRYMDATDDDEDGGNDEGGGGGGGGGYYKSSRNR